MAEVTTSPSGWLLRGVGVTPPARLFRRHRHNLVNVMILGGTTGLRLQVAYAFHRESLLRRGPFVCLDGDRDQNRLRSALQAWMGSADTEAWADPLRAAEQGTFFLDAVGRLSRDTQRMLLAFTGRFVSGAPGGEEAPWVGRLAVGNAEPLSIAVSEGRFSAALYDSLDKVRVELPGVMEGAA